MKRAWWGLSAVVLVVLAVAISAVMAAPKADRDPVTNPASPPLATVAPDVSERMNHGRPKLAPGVRMGQIRAHKGDAGKGRGNGCHKGYGKAGQCLPFVPPSHAGMPGHEHPWTCAEVRNIFKEGIAVRGKKDPLGLDKNGDGVACGSGDG